MAIGIASGFQSPSNRGNKEDVKYNVYSCALGVPRFNPLVIGATKKTKGATYARRYAILAMFQSPSNRGNKEDGMPTLAEAFARVKRFNPLVIGATKKT